MEDECISGTDEKQRGFLVIFHEHHIIQCRHSHALTGWKPSLSSFTTSSGSRYLNMTFRRARTGCVSRCSLPGECRTTNFLAQSPLSLVSRMAIHTPPYTYGNSSTPLPYAQRKRYPGGQRKSRHSPPNLFLRPPRRSIAFRPAL